MSINPRAGWTRRIQNSAGTTLAGSPVIALHGFTGRGSDWAALRDGMKGHAWLTPDLPGHGPAPALPADLDAHLAAVARALGFFTEAPVLLGYSMGARIALHAALARPEDFSALVLIGGSPGLENDAERAARLADDTALAGRIRNQTTPEFLARWDAQPLLAGRARMPEPFRGRSLAARAQSTPDGLAASLLGVGTGALPPLWHRLGELAMPVLLVTGGDDAKFLAIADAMSARAPAFSRATIADAGHAPHLERPAETAALIQAWLAEQPGTDR